MSSCPSAGGGVCPARAFGRPPARRCARPSGPFGKHGPASGPLRGPEPPTGPRRRRGGGCRKLHGTPLGSFNPRMEQPRFEPLGSPRSTAFHRALLILIVAD
jgi:hypothetical protein